MGIKNFHSFMKKKAPNSYQSISLQDLAGKKIAIDTSIFMCRYKSSLGSKWTSGFYTLVHTLVSHNIHFIFIFDGKAPPEKDKEREERMLSRTKVKNKISSLLEEWYQYSEDSNHHGQESLTIKDFENFPKLYEYTKKMKQENFTYNELSIKMMKMRKTLVPISKEDYTFLQEMLSILHVNFLVAIDNQEAESLCVLLNKKNIVDAILTEDTDAIAYGCSEMFFNLNLKENKVHSLKLNSMLNELNFTYPQLKDFCIMCGTDYNKNIKLVGPYKAYSLLVKHQNLEKITEIMNTKDLNFEKGRNLFDCEKFSEDLKIDSIENSSEVILNTLDVKKYLFKNNIKLLF